MAVATITLTPVESWDDGKRIHVCGTLAISAASDTYAAGGLAVPTPAVPGVPSTAEACRFEAEGLAGYQLTYVKSTKKLRVNAQTNAAAEDAPLGELAAAAVPAALSGDTITFYGIYRKFVD